MRDPQLDLVLRGGTVVTAEGQRRADVGVRDGRVAIIQDRDSGDARHRPDGAHAARATSTPRGRLLLPGRRRPARAPAHRGLRPGRARLGRRLHQRIAGRAGGRRSPASATCRTCCRGRASPIACARETGRGRAAGDRRRVLPHRHRRRPAPAIVDEVGARGARRPVEHEDLHVHADVRGQRPRSSRAS